MKHFGRHASKHQATFARAELHERLSIGPNMSLMLDNVTSSFSSRFSTPSRAYPDHWKGLTEMTPTKGRVVDSRRH